MHTTLDPYNTTEEVELTFNNLNSDWTNGQFKILGDDHVISTGRQMTNLVSNFKYLLLLCFLTAAEVLKFGAS